MIGVRWLFSIALAAAAVPVWGQPEPGDVFREYVWTPLADRLAWQRVTDYEARHEGAKAFLPNPTNTVVIPDLEGAERIELVLEQWGGHAGTSDKRVRVNGHGWIDIKESPFMGPDRPECYQYMRYPVIDIPLEQINEGENVFEFNSGGQICHDFGWGQWGVYGAVFRVHYEKGKPHPGGEIVSPKTGDALGGRVYLEAEASSPNGPVTRVDFIGKYTDFNVEGDGLYRQWRYTYRYGDIQNHLGTAFHEPRAAVWLTDWVPDQEQPVEIVARIADASGMMTITPAVTGLSLPRDNISVELCRPYEVPTSWQTRAGRIQSCKVNVEGDLSHAEDARMLLTTWSGGHADEIGINGYPLVKNVGWPHEYSYDQVPVPLHLILPGVNTFYTRAETVHHGIEVLYPGIALKVRYRTGGEGH